MCHHRNVSGVMVVPGRCWITLPVDIAADDLAAFVETEHDGPHYRDRAEAIAAGEQRWAQLPEYGPYTVAQLPHACVQLHCTGCGYLFDEDAETGYHLPDETAARVSARAAGWTPALVCTSCQMAQLVDGARVTVTGTVVDVLIIDLGDGVQGWALLDGPVLLDVALTPAALAVGAALLSRDAHVTVTGTVRDQPTGRQCLTADHITVPPPAW